MSNEVLTVMQKKQAIEQGLKPFMESSVLVNVLEYWEKKYGNLPSFVLNRFIQEVCEAYELKSYRKDMLKKVLSEMALIERHERMEIDDNETTLSQSEFDKQSQMSKAFFYFVSTVVQSVSSKDITEFNSEIRNKLEQAGYQVKTSKEDDHSLVLGLFPIESYANIITTLYEKYCVYYGPSKADYLYARIKDKIKLDYPEVDIHQLL